MWCRLKLSQTTETAHYQSLRINFKSEIMRASSLCLMFGLVLLMAWTSEAQLAHAVPESCCFKFIDFQIPASKIKSALKTSSHCPVSGIVVTTPRTEFCVRPDEAWIKPVMEKQLR
ncbi:chemokine (C-C motif) ligand 33, duplicate 3 isoform X2 [Onychostoma macrolepis]|uniref:chemokine (C-C motif) ligand 33, duplicate 3 isoform X2 n=1 Tax=Onychostoma macrolepis TaxID=369639 RepID=UPI00272AB9B8|nr:chemokine (C-C motif) ligand 33, duplicate 3 isoform X2 [Onychostoma macrolepis]